MGAGHQTPRSGLGAPVRRRETGRFIRGAGTYVDDVKLPDLLHAVFVRSPVAHGLIGEIDVASALELPGVVAVFTAKDLSRVGKTITGTDRVLRVTNALADKKVRYVGEAVAMVLATDRYAAADGADQVLVDYETLPVITDPEAGMLEGASLLYEDKGTNILARVNFSTENFDRVFASGEHVVKARFKSARLAASPIEPRGVVATWEPGDRLKIWTSTAGVHVVRTAVARFLELSEARVEVIGPDVGGSFGGKNSAYPEELAVASASRLLKQPVKWIETRIEHLTTTRHGRDQIHDIEAAVSAEGRVLAIRDRIIEDDGAAPHVDTALSAAFLYVTGGYDIQEYQFDAMSVATNKTPHGALRGIGKADAAWVIERLMDRIAAQVGRDPAEVRKLNFVPEIAFPYRTATGAVLDSGRYETAMDQLLEMVEYDKLRKEQVDLRDRGIWRGIGVSFIIEANSASRKNQGGGYSACRIRMESSGQVAAFPSLGQQGQGHETTIAQIVSGRLSMDIDDVEVIENDTNLVPFGTVTGSSRSSVTLMPAVHVAAGLLADKLIAIAAHHLDHDTDDLELEDGRVRSKLNPAISMSYPEIAKIAYHNVYLLPLAMDPALEVIGYFRNPNIVWEHDEIGRRNEFAVYPYDAAVAVIDVDIETGQIDVVKYASVHDCGKMMNPRIVATQHIGCIVHGIGAALYEEIRYTPDGDPASSTFMDYLLPTANEVPELLLGHIETPTPFTPLGAKGAGETGMLNPPPAIGNAIEDALMSMGAQVNELPYSAVRVLAAIRQAQEKSVAPPQSGLGEPI